MKRVIIGTLVLLLLVTTLIYSASGWYDITWQPNNSWLNDSSQQLYWEGISNKDMAHFGVQYTTSISPPDGKVFDRYLTLVVSSEPNLLQYRIQKIGDLSKYFRSYITHSKVNNLEIDSPNQTQYIPIRINGWSYWGGNFYFNTRSNTSIFPNDEGFTGIYTTNYRFHLYPTAHLLDEEYLLLDETLAVTLKYWGSGEWVATNLVVTPFVTDVDVTYLQQHATEMTVGSVEFFSDDDSSNHTYTINITPGEIGETQFGFHQSIGSATIPYQVRILDSTIPPSSSSLQRIITTRDGNNHWYDYLELAILGFTPNVLYSVGNYQSIIKISLTSNY